MKDSLFFPPGPLSHIQTPFPPTPQPKQLNFIILSQPGSAFNPQSNPPPKWGQGVLPSRELSPVM